jgi:hypothetical protein
MTETKLFVSSCSRRELAKRRSHPRHGTTVMRMNHPALTTLVFLLVCAGAFIAGRGGI